MLILPMPLVAFQPLKPAPGGPATVFPWTENKCEPPEDPVFSFSARWLKSSEQHG